MGYMPHPPTDGTRFGFSVSFLDGEWSVDLPHQCDEWTVGFGEHGEVAAALEQFIGEAAAALERLRRRQPGDESPPMPDQP